MDYLPTTVQLYNGTFPAVSLVMSKTEPKEHLEASMSREQVIDLVLAILRSPLALMFSQSREDALRLAREHGITAADLLTTATTKARRS